MSAIDLTARLAGKPTIAGQTELRLRRDILTGVLAPGAKLNLDKLRETMDVGLSPLREAVTRLVSDGLIEVETHRGYSVAPISIANLKEVSALRSELEPFALRHSIARGGLDWEAAVMAALYRVNKIERDPDDPASRATWEAANNAFHHTLISACEMPLLLKIHGALVTMNDRYRNLYSDAVTVQRDVVEEHTALATAAVERRADAAAEILKAHIDRSVVILLDMIARTHPDEMR
ncbi:FCD domain-containing protein [bacterium]|nr:FCD domain-containing protein [bacterium]